MAEPRPQGVCHGPPDPDPRCWACTYTGGLGTNGYSESRRAWAITTYEDLVETVERLGTFTISSIWRANGKGLSDFGLARHVVHDLWFHRLIVPVQIDTSGKVRRWRTTDRKAA